MVYHQTWGLGKVSWATPKLLAQNSDGSLYLRYWSDLDNLKTDELFSEAAVTSQTDEKRWQLELFGPDASDMMLSCSIDCGNAEAATVLWHHCPGKLSVASGLKVRPKQKTVEMVRVEYLYTVNQFNADTYSTYVRDDYVDPSLISEKMHIKMIVRAHQAEVYLKDIWVFSMDMTDLPTFGGFGLLVEHGSAALHGVTVSALEPLT